MTQAKARILLTGATGQVGAELKPLLLSLGEVFAYSRQNLNLTQPAHIEEAIHLIKPDLIVNAAAYTAVDRAETEIEQARAVNAVAPKVMAEAAQRLGASLIHLSTDYVFDGSHNVPYVEADAPNPLNYYGATKLAGEAAIRSRCDRHLILRTAWVCGRFGQGNFVKTILRLGRDRPELRVVVDQVGAPTGAQYLAMVIAQVAAQVVNQRVQYPEGPSHPVGTFHVTNSGVASWYDVAIATLEEARQLGVPLLVQRVIPITTADYPTPAKRPAYSVLSNQKITTLLKTHAPHWRVSLRHLLSQLYGHFS